MSTSVHGIHHVTCIAGDAQENLDFYVALLGMRLVKKSVNQDDPGTYHLFYADAEGSPGTDLTFFPWMHLGPPRMGHGLAVEVSLEVPADSLRYWSARLSRYGAQLKPIERRFGDSVLPLTDPHGLRLALVESVRGTPRPFTPWTDSPVPAERQVRGLYGAQLWEREETLTRAFLIGALGFEPLATENGWTRYGCRDAAGVVDVRETRDQRRDAAAIVTREELEQRAGVGGGLHVEVVGERVAEQPVLDGQDLAEGGRLPPRPPPGDRTDPLVHAGRQERVGPVPFGRPEPNEVELACCLPVELTPTAGAEITDYLKGSIDQVVESMMPKAG